MTRFSYLYPAGTGWPMCIGFTLYRLLRLSELRWRYSNPPPHWSLTAGSIRHCLRKNVNVTLRPKGRKWNRRTEKIHWFRSSPIGPVFRARCYSKPGMPSKFESHIHNLREPLGLAKWTPFGWLKMRLSSETMWSLHVTGRDFLHQSSACQFLNTTEANYCPQVFNPKINSNILYVYATK
jgi:hypothetical protein